MSVLFVNTCVRNNSRTYALAQYFLNRWPDRDVTEVNPEELKIQTLSQELLKIRDEALRLKDFDHPVLKYARQFAEADTIVIAAPYWDLSFPAALKTYIERINCVGVTFDYDETGNPYGLCKAKRLIYICTAGGPLISDAYGYGYLKALAENFYHIDETVSFIAENLDMPFTDVESELNRIRKQMDEWVKSLK